MRSPPLRGGERTFAEAVFSESKFTCYFSEIMIISPASRLTAVGA
ncbi:Vitellogenin-A2 precursor (VTG A2) (Contains: Lipovitellin I; Lipovitellin II; Phosvitin) (fragment) [Bradyrhizobium sp. ORS 375]